MRIHCFGCPILMYDIIYDKFYPAFEGICFDSF